MTGRTPPFSCPPPQIVERHGEQSRRCYSARTTWKAFPSSLTPHFGMNRPSLRRGPFHAPNGLTICPRTRRRGPGKGIAWQETPRPGTRHSRRKPQPLARHRTPTEDRREAQTGRRHTLTSYPLPIRQLPGNLPPFDHPPGLLLLPGQLPLASPSASRPAAAPHGQRHDLPAPQPRRPAARGWGWPSDATRLTWRTNNENR